MDLAHPGSYLITATLQYSAGRNRWLIGRPLAVTLAVPVVTGATVAAFVMAVGQAPVGPASWLLEVGIIASLTVGPGLSAWRARDEPLWRYAVISVLATAVWVAAAAVGVAAGAAVVWLAWAVTIDSRIRDAVLVWTTLVPRLGALGRRVRRWIARHPAPDHEGTRTRAS